MGGDQPRPRVGQGVAFGVDLDAIHFQVGQGVGAYKAVVFAHAGREGDGVNPTQGDHVGPDVAAQLVDVDVVRQPRIFVFFLDHAAEFAEVIDPGDAFHPGFFV